MYYKSIIQQIKEEDSESRVVITEEALKDMVVYVSANLEPKDINICPQCSSTKVILYGKKKRIVKDEYLTNHTSFLILTYHRFKCSDCGKMFNDSLPLLNAKQSISMSLKLNILEDLRQDISFTTIAKHRDVSIQTVIDIFESYIDYDRVTFGYVLCMDEFKNLKHSNGKYAFVMYDPNAHKINDILENRLQETIDNYLYSIDWHEKDKVKYVITDMNDGYRTIIHKHFVNATHIVDTFHFVRYVEDAFNEVRIRIQGLYKPTDKEYKILKRNWKILSVYSFEIEGNSRYNPMRKKETSLETIIDDAINIHEDLIDAYKLTQDFLKSIREVKFEDAEIWMNNWIKDLKNSPNKEFNKLSGMYINWKREIINSLIRFGDKKLHNGYIEGINNKIKVIKRISYGYSNFTHFRNRIMYIVNGDAIIKNVDRNKIKRKKRNYTK